MRSKLRVDGPAIGSSSDQFAYIYARLEETPQAMAAAFFTRGGPHGNFDPDQFLAYLVACYGDPNTEQRALSKLESMTQGERESFASFLPKFEKELADSGGADWSDVVKINHLKRAINHEMRTYLTGQLSLPKDYPSFVNALQNLGANLDDLRFHTRKRRPRIGSRSPSPVQKTKSDTIPAKGDEMDWEPTKISRVIRQANKELEGKRAKWVDRAEMDRRRKEGRCLRCGRTGCNVAECPLLPPRRPSQATKVQARRTKPVLDAVIDEDEEVTDNSLYEVDEESGKE